MHATTSTALPRQRPWEHSHTFGQNFKQPGETRTLIVAGITAAAAAVEIAAGAATGSMALLADGIHMASHTAALSINALGYVYARRQADDSSFCFGTGKVNALAGFTGALLLAVFAVLMAWESAERIAVPAAIAFREAILVAFFGLLINSGSMVILAGGRPASANRDTAAEDHNLRSACLHVLADSVTSILAISALFAGFYWNAFWLDPLMGLFGSALVTQWSVSLLAATSKVLLDKQGPARISAAIRQAIESKGARVSDLHLWSIGPGTYSLMLSVVASEPRSPCYYKALIPADQGLVHVNVEVHQLQPGDLQTHAAKKLRRKRRMAEPAPSGLKAGGICRPILRGASAVIPPQKPE